MRIPARSSCGGRLTDPCPQPCPELGESDPTRTAPTEQNTSKCTQTTCKSGPSKPAGPGSPGLEGSIPSPLRGPVWAGVCGGRCAMPAVRAEHPSRASHVAICESAPWRIASCATLTAHPRGEYVRSGRLPVRALLHVSLLKGAVATLEGGAPRRLGGLVALLIVAALAVTAPAGASAASAAAARGGRAPISVLAPRAGAVIVARTRAGAKRLRLGATLPRSSRPVGGLSARLNGHPVRLPPIRSGRLGVRLGAANGLAVGENVCR